MKKLLIPLTLCAFGANAALTPGITEPFDVVKVTSEVDGAVLYYNKDIGQSTSSKKILIKIDDKKIKLQRDFALEELNQTKIEKEYYTKRLKRFEDLLKKKNLSESDYDDVVFQLNTASNKINQKSLTLEEKKDAVDNTTIYGLDGYVVSKRNIEVGQYVRSAEEMYELVDIRKLKVSLLASEKIAPFFTIDKKINVFVDDVKIEGVVKYKGVSMAENTYAYPIIIEIDNELKDIPVSKTVFIEYGVDK